MQEKSNCRVVNIRDYLDSDDPMLGENFLREMISRFSCPKKLLSFYENHGYKRFNTRMTTTDNPRELVQLLTMI